MGKSKKHLIILFIVAFIASIQTALPAYINSSFLAKFIDNEFVGLIYSAQAILTILMMFVVPKIISKLGNYKFSALLSLISLLALITVGFSTLAVVIITSFIIYMTAMRILFLSLDFFIERMSENENTGNIRGIYLTAVNMAWVLSPFVSGVLISKFDFQFIYTLSASLAIPVIMILYIKFRNLPIQKYKEYNLLKVLKSTMKNIHIRPVFITNFLLSFFYSIMIIYTPIYLNNDMGLSWDKIGLIFTVMLLPFVLLQIPVGKISDKILGEKELMILGFIIISLSTISITFINSSSLLIWMIILFVTRVGASIIEVMSETHFFKKLDYEDTDTISLWRSVSPVSYIVAPIFATIFLTQIDIKYIFLVLGIIMFAGVFVGTKMIDTK